MTEADRAWRSLGQVGAGREERRGLIKTQAFLYIVADLEAGRCDPGETCGRSGQGLGWRPDSDLVLGKTVKKAVKKGTPLSWDMLL